LNSIRIILVCILITLILGLQSCEQRENYSLLKNIEIPDTSSLKASSSLKLSNADLVDEIASYNRVDSKFTGYGGTTSEQYLRFERLSKYATTNELIELLNNKSAVVRVYAFWGLQDRKNINLKRIILEHIQDTLSFASLQGCIGSHSYINFYFLTYGKYCCLSEKEFKYYKKVVSRCYPKKEWEYMSKSY